MQLTIDLVGNLAGYMANVYDCEVGSKPRHQRRRMEQAVLDLHLAQTLLDQARHCHSP